MAQASYGENENLTLTDADLDSPHGGSKPYGGGGKLRAFCPVHGGDNQRSLELDLNTGRFFCHRCECWGYMDWARERFREERGLEREASRHPGDARRSASVPHPPPPPPFPPVKPVRDDLNALLKRFQVALPGNWGERYLQLRGIPLDIARKHGIGYAAPKEWPGRPWKGGRLVVPHHRPDGALVNLYGRAVTKGEAPKALKHDHLKGNKGWFNARVLARGEGPLHVCEAPLDALALIAAGYERTVAIYGTYGWRWEWIPSGVRRIVLATDADEGGEKAREKIGGEARMRGIEVAYLDAESYGGEKDAAAAYAKDVLRIGAWPEPASVSAADASSSVPAPQLEGEAWDDEWATSLMVRALERVSKEVSPHVDLPDLDAEDDEVGVASDARDRERYRRAVGAWVSAALSVRYEAAGSGPEGAEDERRDPQPRLAEGCP